MTGRDAAPIEHRRRSQTERRRETVDALIAATIETIAEIGYHRTTTAEICARAGVTHGAMFHHFKTRVDLILAALQRMTEQRIASYVEHARAVTSGSSDPLDLLRMVDQLARDDVAIVWAELLVAARTDPELRERVQPAIDDRWSLIRSAATTFPGLAALSDFDRDVWLQLLRGTIELAPLIEPLTIPDGAAAEDREKRRNQALIELAGHLGTRRSSP